jgi:hypothetical protein
MVRRRGSRLSNHEATERAFILRDAPQAALLRMRVEDKNARQSI